VQVGVGPRGASDRGDRERPLLLHRHGPGRGQPGRHVAAARAGHRAGRRHRTLRALPQLHQAAHRAHQRACARWRLVPSIPSPSALSHQWSDVCVPWCVCGAACVPKGLGLHCRHTSGNQGRLVLVRRGQARPGAGDHLGLHRPTNRYFFVLLRPFTEHAADLV
jgi:hypothetical protein